ncbi:hypothetical protein HNP86_001710 [Methanococcus maripaludis]|uniref:Uncharacterized protein n=1 Tax=Methanococcus maripaludis TaxID=39152 RepID=A0A7J9NW55_METMI|nr:hypothetical protein [Methanococcus maripaludis]MBA2851557.1 hypothetical protein [Methanococcus maripaludis]
MVNVKVRKVGSGFVVSVNKTELEYINVEENEEVDKKLGVVDGKNCLIIYKAEE